MALKLGTVLAFISAAVARITPSSLGLGTGDSPTFTAPTATALKLGDGTLAAALVPSVGSVNYATTNDAVMSIFSFGTTAANSGVLQLGRWRGTPASPALTQSSDVFGRIDFVGGQDATSGAVAARIQGSAAAAPGASSDMPGQLVFQVCQDGTTTLATKLTITHAAGVQFNSRCDVNGQTFQGARLATNQLNSSQTLNTSSHIGTVINNSGASGEAILTAPTATSGYNYYFVVETAQFLRFQAASGDVIRGDIQGSGTAGTITTSATAGYIRSNEVGAFLHVIAVDATTWQIVGIGGTWTIDS